MAGISVRGLRKTFGEATALKSVDFEVAEGEVISVLGPSGCGKTTTLRCIAGLEQGDSGQIYIKDKLVSDFATGHILSPDRRGIGMVFQSYAIWPHMTVAKNVGYPLIAQGKVAKDEIGPIVDRTLALVGMQEYASRPATNLSGGQQQRVALARALVSDPSVLLLDEPLSNLDAKLRDQTRFEVRQIQQRLGLTALYVTHDQSEAMAISDRIIVMNKGEIEQIGAPAEIYQRPVSAFVADFVGASNFLDVTRLGAAKNGNVTVALANGDSFEVPALVDSDKFKVALRPQYCSVVAPDTPVMPGHNRLTGTIQRTTYFGERSEALVQAGNNELLVYLPIGTPFQSGAKVQIGFLPEHCVPLRH